MQNDGVRTLTVSVDQGDYIDELVASGTYASTSDVISAGLDALRDRNAGVEHWLRDEVAATYDAMQANPGRARTVDTVRAHLADHHAAAIGRRAV